MKQRYFELARKLSLKSIYKYKLGCVLVSGSRVIGMGFNRNKTSPKANTPYRTVHAELDALLDSRRGELDGCDVYVYRETKDGYRAIAKPCKACYSLLKQAGVRRVYYTTSVTPFYGVLEY